MNGACPTPGAFLKALWSKPWWRGLAISLLLVSFAGCDKTAPPPATELIVGRAFPSFMLDFISGGADVAPSLRGKMLVLNIWATWCPPCRREMPSLELLSKTLDPTRFAVIGLSTDSDALLASEFLAQNGISFANFLDQNGRMARQLGMQVYPETFVIAPDRTLLRRMPGLYDWGSPEMVAMLEGLYQAQKSVKVGGVDVRH